MPSVARYSPTDVGIPPIRSSSVAREVARAPLQARSADFGPADASQYDLRCVFLAPKQHNRWRSTSRGAPESAMSISIWTWRYLNAVQFRYVRMEHIDARNGMGGAIAELGWSEARL